MRAGALRADLGHFRWAKAAGKGELNLVRHLLVAKYQDGMFLEGRTRRVIQGIVGRDIRERHAVQLGAESRTQRDNVHRQVSLVVAAYGKQ